VNPSVETEFQTHDTLRITASSMEPNATNIMQQKNLFHQPHCKRVSEQIKSIAISVYKRAGWCACCCFLFFSIHKVVWPADADKITNLAQHPKSLGTAASTLHLPAQQLLTSRLLKIPLRLFIYEDWVNQRHTFHKSDCSLSLSYNVVSGHDTLSRTLSLSRTYHKSVLQFRSMQASCGVASFGSPKPQAFSLTYACVLHGASYLPETTTPT